MNIKYIITLAAVLSVVGCAPSPEVTEVQDAQALVDSIVYVKSKSGICFGVATSSRLSTKMDIAVNQLLTTVDCNAVNL